MSSYFNAGGGLTLALTHNTELHAIWIGTVSGRSGAHRARMLAIGASWSFGSMMDGFDAAGSLKEAPSRSIRPRAEF